MATNTLLSGSVSSTRFSLRLILHELMMIALLVVLLMMTLTRVMIGWVVIPAMVSSVVHDQIFHLDFAVTMFNTGTPPIAHFLYQALVIGLQAIIHYPNWLLSAVLANLLPQLFTSVIIYLGFRVCFRDFEDTWRPAHKWIMRCVCVGLALGLVIAEPVFTLLTTVNGLPNQILLGFIAPTTYHNPTTTILRPFALSLYLLIIAYVLPSQRLQPKRGTSTVLVGLMIVVTLLCGLSKPNYLLALLPALCVWLVWASWRKQPIAWRLIFMGVLLPTLVMLAWQFLFTFVYPTNELETSGGIVFDPFKVVLGISGADVGIMALRFGVSLLFPATVYLLWWKAAKQHVALNFAWLTFIFGAFFMYFLAESGLRWSHGNFFWSAYITLFILNIASLRFAVQMRLALRQSHTFWVDWRTLLIVVLFLLHVMSGIYYIDWANQWLYAMVLGHS